MKNEKLRRMQDLSHKGLLTGIKAVFLTLMCAASLSVHVDALDQLTCEAI